MTKTTGVGSSSARTPRWLRPPPIPAAGKRLFRNARFAVADCFAVVHPAPIFVLGHQKSGTTAIARLLAAALGESYSHDMFSSRKWADMSDIYRGRITARQLVKLMPSEFSAAVIKDPDLTLLYRSLLATFPQAKFVFVVRDPRDTIASLLDRLGIPGNYSDMEIEQIRRIIHGALWRGIFDPTALGVRSLNYIEILAYRWNKFYDIGASAEVNATQVRYEDFNHAKTETIEELCVWLGRDVRQDIGVMVDHQFQPVGTRDRHFPNFFGVKNLTCIEQVCRTRMERMGYAVVMPSATLEVRHE